MTGPISASIMALHSMCHPGRPGPQGDSQDGSPGLALCKTRRDVPQRLIRPHEARTK